MIPLRIVSASEEGRRAIDSPLVKTTLPWGAYEVLYSIRLGDSDPITVAQGTGLSFDVFDICHFPTLDLDQINKLRTIQHENIVTVHEIHQAEAQCHVVFEHMARSLQEALGNPRIDSERLAAIVGQVRLLLPQLGTLTSGRSFGRWPTSRTGLYSTRV